jgi:hypothetical protein
MLIFKFVYILFYFVISLVDSFQITTEHILLKNLIKNYEPSIRPLQNHNSTLNIYFRLKLTQVLELSETHQTLTTNMWVEQVRLFIK